MEQANSFTNVFLRVSTKPPEKCNMLHGVQHAQIGHALLPVFSALDENSNFALDWSRDKSEGTKMISDLALVGVGAKMKFLSGRVNELIG